MRIVNDGSLAQSPHRPRHPIGLSAGSAIARDAALDNPTRVDRIVLSGSAPSGYAPKQRPSFFTDLMAALKAGDYAKANDVILATSVFAAPPESQALVRQMVTDNGRLSRVPVALLKPPPPAVDRLDQVSVPTLVLIGENDLLQRAPAELLAQQIPNARIVRVADGGHLLNLTSPSEFEAAVRGISAPGQLAARGDRQSTVEARLP